MREVKTEPKIAKRANLGKLHKMLLEACPPHDGRKSIPILAEELGVTRQCVYKWIATNTIPPRFVRIIVKMSKGKQSVEDYYPFVGI